MVTEFTITEIGERRSTASPFRVAQRTADTIDRPFVGKQLRMAFPGHKWDGEGRLDATGSLR